MTLESGRVVGGEPACSSIQSLPNENTVERCGSIQFVHDSLDRNENTLSAELNIFNSSDTFLSASAGEFL